MRFQTLLATGLALLSGHVFVGCKQDRARTTSPAAPGLLPSSDSSPAQGDSALSGQDMDVKEGPFLDSNNRRQAPAMYETNVNGFERAQNSNNFLRNSDGLDNRRNSFGQQPWASSDGLNNGANSFGQLVNFNGLDRANSAGVHEDPKSEDNEEQVEHTCPICMEAFKENERVHTTQCKHRFHAGCLREWTDMHSNCPMCRKYVASLSIQV